MLIKVHASALNTGDTQAAGGSFRLLEASYEGHSLPMLLRGLQNRDANHTPRFPFSIGMENAGVVVATGSG